MIRIGHVHGVCKRCHCESREVTRLTYDGLCRAYRPSDHYYQCLNCGTTSEMWGPMLAAAGIWSLIFVMTLRLLVGQQALWAIPAVFGVYVLLPFLQHEERMTAFHNTKQREADGGVGSC